MQLLKLINDINEWIGRLFSVIIILIMCLVILEVVMRRFFNAPTIWSFEVVVQLYGSYFMLIIAYGLLHNTHVSVDLLSSKLNLRNQGILSLFSYVIFFFPFVIAIIWKGSTCVAKSWAIFETSSSYFAPPLYLVKTSIPISACLLLAQGVVEVVNICCTKFGRKAQSEQREGAI